MADLCNGGDLYKFIKARKYLSENEARKILLQIVSGMKALFENNVVHRDLKLENILLNFPNRNLLDATK